METLILSIRIERRWPLQALMGVALAWGVAALVLVLRQTPPVAEGAGGLLGVLGVVLAVLPPLALGLMAAALLPAGDGALTLPETEARLAEARAAVTGLEEKLVRVDAVLASSIEQTRALTAAASTTLPGLGETAAMLEGAAGRVVDSGARTQAIVDGFAAALPALERTIATVDQTLRAVSSDSAVQLRGVETTLATVHERGRAAAAEADTAIAAMTALLTRIDEASSRNTAALSKRAYALDAAVDGVLERTTAAVDHMREAVEERMTALESGVDQAARQLTLLGDDSARLFNQRLELLLATARTMQGHFAEQEASSARLQAVVGEHVEAMAGRLADFDANSHAAVDALAGRLAAVTEQAAGLTPPIEATTAAVAALGSEAEAFGNKAADVDDVVTERLSQLRTTMAGLEAEAARLQAVADALNDSVAQGQALVGDAAGALGRERETIEAMAAGLAGQFETARAAVAEVAAQGDAAAQRIETGLAADVARVVVAGEAAAAGIREALAIVVDEAVERLGARAGAEAETAFAAPIRTQIEAIEAATARANAGSAEAAGQLAVVAEESGAAADALAARLATLTAQAEALAVPIETTRATIAALEGEAEALGNKVADVEEVLNERLSGTRQSMVGLESEAARLFETVAALGSSVKQGSDLIGDAASALATEREAVTAMTTDMAGHFETARAALAEIEAGSAAASSAIETGLAADVSRVMAAGEAAVTSIREGVAAVVSEAVSKLEHAADSSAVQAFAAPVRAEIEAIETATARAAGTGQEAAGRLAAQMMRLAATVETVEGRIGDVETRYAMRARDTLAARSTRLISQLNAASVDVAGLLSISIENDTWNAYLRGDRGVFARAIASGMDRETTRQMARLYQHDSDFQGELVRFCDMFEDLITRLLGDGDGATLASMMLSSDLGKLYVAMAEAAGRLPPGK